MMVHLADAIENGPQSVMIRTADTDVVVLAVATVVTLDLKEVLVSFGTGKNHNILPAHLFAKALGPSKSKCLPVFHALTGATRHLSLQDTAKKTAWAAWENFPEVTIAFLELASAPSAISEENLSIIERYVILIYDRTSHLNKVNDAQKYLFTKKGRGLEELPPTHDALEQHLKRATYQGGFVWGQATIPMPVLPNPTDWGWTVSREGQMQPLWVTLPAAAVSCKELVHCGCKKTCGKRCKCVKADLPCTPLCVCDGQCLRD
ncbi:hypothetical protein ACROYT_G034002 [Oculina patagonica]